MLNPARYVEAPWVMYSDAINKKKYMQYSLDLFTKTQKTPKGAMDSRLEPKGPWALAIVPAAMCNCDGLRI